MKFSLKTLGTDPEIFGVSKGDNCLVPPHAFVHGAKKSPQRVGDSVYGIGVLADGAAFELNTAGFASSHEQWNALVWELREATTALGERFGVEFLEEDAVKIPDHLLGVQEFYEIGCEADYDAYTGKVLPRPDIHSFGAMRYAGGHIHIGLNSHKQKYDTQDLMRVIKACDLTIGLIDPCSAGRRQYISAGRFRYVKQGHDPRIEYRTPSNWWMFSAVATDLWALVDRAIAIANEPNILGDDPDSLFEKVRDAINSKRHLEEALMLRAAVL